VEIPLPLLGAIANIENSFFDLCIGVVPFHVDLL